MPRKNINTSSSKRKLGRPSKRMTRSSASAGISAINVNPGLTRRPGSNIPVILDEDVFAENAGGDGSSSDSDSDSGVDDFEYVLPEPSLHPASVVSDLFSSPSKYQRSPVIRPRDISPYAERRYRSHHSRNPVENDWSAIDWMKIINIILLILAIKLIILVVTSGFESVFFTPAYRVAQQVKHELDYVAGNCSSLSSQPFLTRDEVIAVIRSKHDNATTAFIVEVLDIIVSDEYGENNSTIYRSPTYMRSLYCYLNDSLNNTFDTAFSGVKFIFRLALTYLLHYVTITIGVLVLIYYVGMYIRKYRKLTEKRMDEMQEWIVEILKRKGTDNNREEFEIDRSWIAEDFLRIEITKNFPELKVGSNWDKIIARLDHDPRVACTPKLVSGVQRDGWDYRGQ